MNLLILTCLLCFVVCSTLATQGSDAPPPEAGDEGVPLSPSASDVQPSPGEGDDGPGSGAEPAGGGEDGSGDAQDAPPAPRDADVHPRGGARKKPRGKGKKRRKEGGGATTPLKPLSLPTSGLTSTPLPTDDPCASTHEHYCVHGSCKSIDGLSEPVCTCWKDYDGERCEIYSLGSRKEEGGRALLTQTALVVVAVVLSVISCLAVVLLICAHYRSHKHFLASYLGTAAEQEKLQKNTADVVV